MLRTILAIHYHFCGPSDGFFKIDHVFLIEIEVNPTHTLKSFAAHWQHLNIAWPQQVPTKGVNKPKTSEYTTKVKIKIMVEKSPLSSLTYVIT
jgi:hypothetical protein